MAEESITEPRPTTAGSATTRRSFPTTDQTYKRASLRAAAEDPYRAAVHAKLAGEDIAQAPVADKRRSRFPFVFIPFSFPLPLIPSPLPPFPVFFLSLDEGLT